MNEVALARLEMADAEVDDEGQSFIYLGAATEGTIFFNVFAGYLQYEFEDDDILRDATIKSITPALGIKKEGPLTLTLAAGPILREKEEEQDDGDDRTTEVGGFVQFGSYYWGNKGTFEGLVSYTTLDDFFWGRIRGKRKTVGRLYAGAEFFLMGNSDFDSWGLGPLLEFRGDKASILLKGGYKHTSTFNDGMYTGIELFTSF